MWDLSKETTQSVFTMMRKHVTPGSTVWLINVLNSYWTTCELHCIRTLLLFNRISCWFWSFHGFIDKRKIIEYLQTHPFSWLCVRVCVLAEVLIWNWTAFVYNVDVKLCMKKTLHHRGCLHPKCLNKNTKQSVLFELASIWWTKRCVCILMNLFEMENPVSCSSIVMETTHGW